MGSANAWLTAAVAAVDAATQALGLQCDIVHEQWAGANAFGDPLPFVPVPRTALVQEGVLHHKSADGQVVTTKARLSFLRPITPGGWPGRQEPVDPRDEFTLPSGLIARSVEIPGVLVDPQTNHPYVSTVWLA